MAAPDRITSIDDNFSTVQAQVENESKSLKTVFESAVASGAEMGRDQDRNFHVNDPLPRNGWQRFSFPHFSIREYVAKVRTVDMSKCWPFSANLLEDSLRSEGRNPLLPPLVVPKYKWWACDRFPEKEESLLQAEQLNQFKIHDIEAAGNYATQKDDIIDKELTLFLDPFPGTGHEDFVSGESDGLTGNIAGAVDVLGQLSYSPEEKPDLFAKWAAYGNSKNNNNIKQEGDQRNGESLHQVNTDVGNAPSHEGKDDQHGENIFHEKIADSRAHGKRQIMSPLHDESELNQIHVQRATLDDTMSKEFDICQKNESGNIHQKPDKIAAEGGQIRTQSDVIGDQLNSEGNKIESPGHNSSDLFNTSEPSVLKMCPVCRIFTSTTITTVNAHMDNCLGQVSKMEMSKAKMLRHKARTQKKRSLADICAAALPLPIVEVNGPSKNDLPAGSCSSDTFEPVLHTRTENPIPGQSKTPMKKGLETATTLNGRKRRTSKKHSFMQNGNIASEDRHPESLEMRRKRQRLGIMQTRVSASREIEETVKAVRMPSAIHLSGMHQDALCCQNESGKAVMNVDYSKDEQRSSMQLHSEHDDDIPMDVVELMAKNQHERCAHLPSHNILKEYITANPNEQQSATATIKKIDTLECSFTDIRHEGNCGSSLREVDIHGPNDKCSIAIMSDQIDRVPLLSGEEGPVPSSSKSSDAATKTVESLDHEECRHDNRDNAQTSIFYSRDSLAKLEDPDLEISRLPTEQHDYVCTSAGAGKSPKFNRLNEEQNIEPASKPSCNHALKQVSLGQPNISSQHAELVKLGDNFISQIEEEKGQHLTSKSSSDKDKNNSHLHMSDGMVTLKTVEQSKPNSKALHCLQNEAIRPYSRMILDGFGKNAGTNINQKVVVPPRDSKGRFTSSDNTNGQKEGVFSLSCWKQAISRKSTKPLKNNFASEETSAATNSALSHANVEKSASIQTNMQHCNDCGGSNPLARYKSVALESLDNAGTQQAGPFAGEINMLSVCREGIVAKSELSTVGASTSQNATNLVRFCMQKRCANDGFIGLPLNSQGGLMMLHPNSVVGANQLYMGQNPMSVNSTLVIKGSKGFPESMFAIDTCDLVTMEDQTVHISRNSAPCIPKCLSKQIYSIQNEQVDQFHHFSVPKVNHLEVDRENLSQAPLLHHIPAKQMDVRRSELKLKAKANETPDTSLNLPVVKDALIVPGSKGNQNKKYSTMEKTISAVQSSRKEPLTARPVMRLMGKNFTVGCGNEAGHEIKEIHPGSGSTAQSSSEATADVALAQKSNMGHISYCITKTDATNQFCLLEDCEVDALYHHPRGVHRSLAEKMSEDSHGNFRQAQCPETTSISDAAKEGRRLNSLVSTPVETRFASNCVCHGQYFKGRLCYSEKAWNNIPAFSTTNTLIPPVSCLPCNPAVNQMEKMMPHKHFCKNITAKLGKSEPSSEACSCHSTCFENIPGNLRGRVPKNHIYTQNQNSGPMHHACQNPGCSGCTHVLFRNPRTLSPPKCESGLPQWLLNAQKQKEANEASSYKKAAPKSQLCPALPYPSGTASVTKQSPCEISNPVPLFAPLPYVRCVFSHPTSNPTLSHTSCQPSSLISSVADPSTLAMQQQHTGSSLDLIDRRKLKLSNESNDRSKIKHEKRSIADKLECIPPEGRCPAELMTEKKGKTVQGTEGLPGEMFLQNHQEFTVGSEQNNSQYLVRPKKHIKRTFYHKRPPSSVTGKHPKETRVYQNTMLDGTSAEMCRITENPVALRMHTDREESVNISNKRTMETVLNAPLQTGVSPKLGSGVLTKSNNNPLGNQVQTSRVGLHCPNAEPALKLAEPMKLSGGAKHILKPPSTNANATQSLPSHYTVPFVRTDMGEREKDLQSEHRYIGEHQGPPQGLKYMKWVSRSSWLDKPSNG